VLTARSVADPQRGLGRQDGIRMADRVELGQNLAIERQPFGDGLDDEVIGSAASPLV
jgi:hypothetical protein